METALQLAADQAIALLNQALPIAAVCAALYIPVRLALRYIRAL